MRTQYGQELSKVRRSLHLGDDLKHVPKIWWFEHLTFLKPYIRQRTSNEAKWTVEPASDEDTLTEIQLQTMPESKIKRLRTSEASEITVVQKGDTTDLGNEKYVIYEENLHEESINDVQQQSEIIVEPYQAPKAIKRHDEIGKFVSAQMATITDDLLFYNTQHEILTVINRAQIKQLEKNLSGSSRMINIIETTE